MYIIDNLLCDKNIYTKTLGSHTQEKFRGQCIILNILDFVYITPELISTLKSLSINNTYKINILISLFYSNEDIMKLYKGHIKLLSEITFIDGIIPYDNEQIKHIYSIPTDNIIFKLGSKIEGLYVKYSFFKNISEYKIIHSLNFNISVKEQLSGPPNIHYLDTLNYSTNINIKDTLTDDEIIKLKNITTLTKSINVL